MSPSRMYAERRSAPAESSWQAPTRALPHHSVVQGAFGRHSLADIRIHSGPTARSGLDKMGVRAASIGTRVFLRRDADLHVAAHEAAHVVQQHRGMTDAAEMEAHADEVADRVASGRSAEDLLDSVGAEHGPPVSRLVAYGGEVDVTTPEAAAYRKRAFEESRDEVEEIFKDPEKLAILSRIVGMEITSADAAVALTVPVVFESEVDKDLDFADEQAKALDMESLQTDRERVWKERAEDLQAFFAHNPEQLAVDRQMIAILDQTRGERYQTASGEPFVNEGAASFKDRLVHEYVHAAIFNANKRRRDAMNAITTSSLDSASLYLLVRKLDPLVPPGEAARQALQAQLVDLGALEESRLLASDYLLEELVWGLMRFEAGHGLEETGLYEGKTKEKLDSLRGRYVGGHPTEDVEHEAIDAIEVAVAQEPESP